MVMQLQAGSGIIFMKVGLHAQETIDEIIDRKLREYDEAGMIFWGYGGNCHPLHQVQPFVRLHEQGGPVYLVMQKMDSRHSATPKVAEEYSDDGLNWKPVPPGIKVTGSRYAMVLDRLEPEEFDLDLNAVTVGIGPRRGRNGFEYIRGRVDKACFEYVGSPAQNAQDAVKHISLVARVKAPYAVFVR